MNWLRGTDLPLAGITDQSEDAFSRAFKTFTGKTSGAGWREARKRAMSEAV